MHPAPQGPAAKGAPAGPQEELDIVIDCPAPLPACNASRLKTLHDLRMSSNNKGPMEHVDHIINMVISVFEVPSAWITILGDEVSDTPTLGDALHPCMRVIPCAGHAGAHTQAVSLLAAVLCPVHQLPLGLSANRTLPMRQKLKRSDTKETPYT